MDSIVEILVKKGVRIPAPQSVEIGPEVDPDRISGELVTLHAGCRLFGGKTLILPGVELGHEAPVTVSDCQLGPSVKLNGGFFQGACFLEGASMGSGAQVREGSLLEEGARGAHSVGLKQTILLPFVTLGSLVNFCDCLMAGGTDARNHSEVGSSYVHFNYTPNQDKATASLIGDVPRGVMLKQPPIFLGGQGGIVGPVQIAYGSVAAAGTILRADVLSENTLILGQRNVARNIPHRPGVYSQIGRIIQLNTLYIGNLAALRQWYLIVRSRFMNGGPMQAALHAGAVQIIDRALRERIRRLGEVAHKLPLSLERIRKTAEGRTLPKAWHEQREFLERWPDVENACNEALDAHGDPALRDEFMKALEASAQRTGKGYLNAVKGLSTGESDLGTRWLQGIVNHLQGRVLSLLPALNTTRN